MKLLKSIVIMHFMLPLGMYAQEEVSIDSVSIETTSIKEDTTKVRPVSIETLQKQIAELTAKVKTLSESETELKGKQYDDKIKIQLYETRIRRLEQKLIFADSIVARLSNDCLRKKYDPASVANAISNFDQMYSPELKSKFGRLKNLLNNYGKYTEELKAVFVEAQNDKAISNPFTGQKQALSYIEKIKATRYYREVYNDNWTIPYLNKIIEKSIETINTFNPRESKEIHLLELLN